MQNYADYRAQQQNTAVECGPNVYRYLFRLPARIWLASYAFSLGDRNLIEHDAGVNGKHADLVLSTLDLTHRKVQ